MGVNLSHWKHVTFRLAKGLAGWDLAEKLRIAKKRGLPVVLTHTEAEDILSLIPPVTLE
jgi:hypothetical protein